MNVNTGQIVVNETTSYTSSPLPPLQFCQNYIVNVTVFSSQQQGDSMVTDLRPPGSEYVGCVLHSVSECVYFIDHYQFKTISTKIIFRESSAAEFLVTLRVTVC